MSSIDYSQVVNLIDMMYSNDLDSIRLSIGIIDNFAEEDQVIGLLLSVNFRTRNRAEYAQLFPNLDKKVQDILDSDKLFRFLALEDLRSLCKTDLEKNVFKLLILRKLHKLMEHDFITDITINYG
jgi:hypothetical protein